VGSLRYADSPHAPAACALSCAQMNIEISFDDVEMPQRLPRNNNLAQARVG
jgi:hypothetical protein